MRLFTICLLAALACPATGQTRDRDSEARAALALALASQGEVVKGELCPCSLTGTCECSTTDSCGCAPRNLYRWIATRDPNQTALYKGDTQVGNWWHAEKEFKRLIDRHGEPDVWTHETCPCTPPAPTPKAKVVPVSVPQTFIDRPPVMLSPLSFGGNCGPRG